MNAASTSWDHGWRGAIKVVLMPLLLGVGGWALGHRQARETFEHDHLPIEPNRSIDITGSWTIAFADERAYEMDLGDSSTGPMLVMKQEVDVSVFDTATIRIDENAPSFHGLALTTTRTWHIEGYVDNEGILYVYKDDASGSSFGSGFLRRVTNRDEYVGFYTGLSPSFEPEGGPQIAGPIVVSGRVRWTRQ